MPKFFADELRSLVERWFDQVGTLHGVEVRLLDFHRANGAARFRAQFVGPLRHLARLLFDITLDEPVLLPLSGGRWSCRLFPPCVRAS